MRSGLVVLLYVLSATASAAAWERVAVEPDRRFELDRESVRQTDPGRKTAWARVVLLPDEAKRAGYMILKTFNRYDCKAYAVMPVRREFLSAQLVVIRDEPVSDGKWIPLEGGSTEEKILESVCRPTHEEIARTAEEIGKAIVAERDRRRASASAGRRVPVARWSYEGATGPAHWARLSSAYARCTTGKRQSPIDLKDGIQVDMPPLAFEYESAPLRVVDTGRTIRVSHAGGILKVAGQEYQLSHLEFHMPGEDHIGGRRYAMSADLVHQDRAGRRAIVTVLIEAGMDHPLVQTVWNYLPLEQGLEVAPPDVSIDLRQLLPESRAYYAYVGSLTTPPCTEGILRLVMKTPVQMSAQQLAIFERLYPMNARPLQPANGRLIKESR